MDILRQVVFSMVPPVSKPFQKVPDDVIGPVCALAILSVVLNYGYSFKRFWLTVSPLQIVLLYAVSVPPTTFVLCRLGSSQLSLLQIVSLVGYSLFGHIFTLFVSLLLFDEESNYFFFLCLIVFGGLGTLRLFLFLLWSIPKPGARLIICSIVSVVNLLFIIFNHFAYMHPTFEYPSN